MTDQVSNVGHEVSEKELASMTDGLNKIFEAAPKDQLLVKAKIAISGLKPGVWQNASADPYIYRGESADLEYAKVDLKTFDTKPDFNEIVKLGLGLNRLINGNPTYLSAPDGLGRMTDLRLESDGHPSDPETTWRLRLTTFGEEDSPTAQGRLEKIKDSITFDGDHILPMLSFDPLESN